jgi:hypothetical protein
VDDDDFLSSKPTDTDADVLPGIASALAKALEIRAHQLRAEPTFDTLALEARAQMAALAVSGNILGLMQMGELLSELYMTAPRLHSEVPESEPEQPDIGDTVWPSEDWPEPVGEDDVET